MSEPRFYVRTYTGHPSPVSGSNAAESFYAMVLDRVCCHLEVWTRGPVQQRHAPGVVRLATLIARDLNKDGAISKATMAELREGARRRRSYRVTRVLRRRRRDW